MSKEPIILSHYIASDDPNARICMECGNHHATIEWDDGLVLRCLLWRNRVTGEYIDTKHARSVAEMCNDGLCWKPQPEPKPTILHNCLATINRLTSWIWEK